MASCFGANTAIFASDSSEFFNKACEKLEDGGSFVEVVNSAESSNISQRADELERYFPEKHIPRKPWPLLSWSWWRALCFSLPPAPDSPGMTEIIIDRW